MISDKIRKSYSKNSQKMLVCKYDLKNVIEKNLNIYDSLYLKKC